MLFMCVYLTRSILFLFLSSRSIANISEWVLQNGFVLCMCVCLIRSTYFSPCLLPPLSISASEFYWMVLCCVCVCVHLTRSNLLAPLQLQDVSFTEWSCVVYLDGLVLCVWSLTRSNLFLSLSACSIANISQWVLLNGLVLYMFDQK